MKDPFIVERPFLRDVCPTFARALASECANIGRSDLADEIGRVVVPPQLFAGSSEAYSFLAYPVPRLTYQERMALELSDFELVRVPMRGGEVGLELDDFGKIGWLYVKGLPEFFEPLQVGVREHAL